MSAGKATYLTRVLVDDRMDAPHAWVQWKGTDVCMDVHCECGGMSHIHGEFAYFVRCADCGKVWAVGSSVRLHGLSPEEIEYVKANCCPILEDEDPQW